MKRTEEDLDVDSTIEFNELNDLIKKAVFLSSTSLSLMMNNPEDDPNTSICSNDSLQEIEWNKMSTLFRPASNDIFSSYCPTKLANSESILSNSSISTMSNESQCNLSPSSSETMIPSATTTSNVIGKNTSPLKLNQLTYVPITTNNANSNYINKFDSNNISSISIASIASSTSSSYYPKQSNHKNPNANNEKSIINLNDIITLKDKRTTLMIRHIPNKYTLKLFTNEINQKFKNKYDVFYLPIDYVNNCNLGFAFINFVDPLHVIDFYETFRGRKWKKYFSDKICELAYAKIQGKQNLITHFEKGSVLNYQTEDKKPLILPTPVGDKIAKVCLSIKFLALFKESFPKARYVLDKEKKHIIFDNCSINIV